MFPYTNQQFACYNKLWTSILSKVYFLFSKGGNVMFDRMREDIATIRERDPAAGSAFEVWWLYNGYKALRSHRLAHWLSRHGCRLLARWVSQRCVRRTNIEIHPGASIGRRFFIDHGTGVVIGETTVIGDDCTIYQGVTLGGTGKDQGKRHPTLGNHVMVGSGAKILGPITIGNNVRIAAGAVVLNDIPDNCTAVGIPAKVVRRDGEKVKELDQVNVPDPVAQELRRLEDRIAELERQLTAK
jgi:serine O-acetyltransferase